MGKAPNAKAVTAANPKESSWGWYCAGSGTGGDSVDGKAIKSCLGDEFSVRWMEDTESANTWAETVGQQYAKLLHAVTKSHVQEYGVTSFDSEPIGDFQGSDGQLRTELSTDTVGGHGVDSRQVEVHQAYFKVFRSKTPTERKVAELELSKILSARHAVDVKFAAIASSAAKGDKALAEKLLEGPVGEFNATCHKATLQVVIAHCGAFTDYSLRYSRLFANLCAVGVEPQESTASIESGCGSRVVV